MAHNVVELNLFVIVFVFLITGAYVYFLMKADEKRIKSIKDFCRKEGLGYKEYIPVYVIKLFETEKEKKPKAVESGREADFEDILDAFLEPGEKAFTHGKTLKDFIRYVPLFKLTTRGRRRSFYNVAHGSRGDIDFLIMDFYYDVGGKNGGRCETLCVLHGKGNEVPGFYIEEEDILDKLNTMFGKQDIDFYEDSKFSSKFILQGEEEGELRSFFDGKVRNAFVYNHIPSCRYEHNFGMTIFSQNKYMSAEERVNFLGLAVKLYVEAMPANSEVNS